MNTKSTPNLLHELDFGSLSSRQRRSLASVLLQMPERDEARGERITRLREDAGLSQPQVVRGLEDQEGGHVISLRGYQEWEAGGNLKPDNLRALAAYHRVEKRWISSGETEAPGDRPPMLITAADIERLKRVEEKLDELLKRTTGPAEQPPPPATEPDADDRSDVPDRLPDAPDEDEDDSQAAG